MSSLTGCNYCSVMHIKMQAKQDGSKVFMQPKENGKLGGLDIYVIPRGEKLDEKKHWKCWVMELTQYCVCD